MERTDILCAGANLGKQKVISMIFRLGLVNNGHNHLVHCTLNLLYLKSEFMNWVDVLHSDCDAIFFC